MPINYNSFNEKANEISINWNLIYINCIDCDIWCVNLIKI
jgi:hypothetical protein